MNIKIHITVSDKVDLMERTIEYFKQSGFKQIAANKNKTIFKRGSIASNLWTFNPLNWKSEITIEVVGQEITADFKINTVGQIPTYKEEQLWNTLIESYERFLNDKTFDFKAENNHRLTDTKKNSLYYAGWALIGGLIGGILAALLAYYSTGIISIIPISAAIGSAIGALWLFAKKINDDKKKSTLYK